MRRPDRSINIFSLSMLDVISGALGAFLIVMVILMPFYNKTHIDYREEIRQLQAEMAALAQRAEAAERSAEAARAQAAAAERRAEAAAQRAAEAERHAAAAQQRLSSVRFLIFSIRWSTERQDVDLHVVDPSGAEFYWRRRTVPGRPGELTQDNIYGPGMEIWEIHNAPPGEYRFYVNLYARRGNPQNPRVQARLNFREGTREFPPVTLTREQQKALVATATVGPDGNVVIRTP